MKQTIEYHGDSKRGPYYRLYRIWAGMKNRCLSPTCSSYDRYGGRGIKICDEWAESYLAFKTWAIANGYKNDLTIDRIDVNGNYEPDNCRWATYSEQNANQRPRATYEYDGLVYSLDELAEISGLPRSCIYSRIHNLRWSVDEAIHTHIGEQRHTYTSECHFTPKWAQGEPPFEDYKIYVCGAKPQRCAMVVMVPYDDVARTKTSMSYARYKMCIREKRLLDPAEIVQHKDGDISNDAFENLEITFLSDNSRKYGLSQGCKCVLFKCPSCGIRFIKRRSSTHLSTSRTNYTCCSKECAGRFSVECVKRPDSPKTIECLVDNVVAEFVDHSGVFLGEKSKILKEGEQAYYDMCNRNAL